MKSAAGYRERGIASWYGTKFHGRRTSSGERYDMYRMTAAHKALPLPTYVEVRNLRNGRTAVLRVNDRGPFHDGRLIDLSYAAALKLDIVGTGTGLVEVRALSPGEHRGPLPAPDRGEPLPGPAPLEARDGPPPAAVAAQSGGSGSGAAAAPAPGPAPAPAHVLPEEPRLWVQLGAFRDAANAHELAGRVEASLGVTARVQDHVGADGVTLRRVRIGPLVSVDAVDALLARLRQGNGMPEGRVVIEP
jgi:rare lipoprotein A